LKKLFLNKVSTSELEGGIYKLLKNLPHLESIETFGSLIDENSVNSFGKILSDNKNMRELNFSGATYSNKVAKEIADGLMRAKMLDVLKLRNAGSIEGGITSILYNLAFSPRIKLIDLTNFNISKNANLCEALYKLLKISGSLEHLILNKTNCTNGLTRDFFLALGENKTIQSLHLNSSK